MSHSSFSVNKSSEKVSEKFSEKPDSPIDSVQTKNEKKKKQRRKAQSWSSLEDQLLLSGVEKYGISNWVEIAKHVGTRSRKQCRERYVNHVCPSIDNRNWTLQEDLFILKAHGQMNDRWCTIAKTLKGRTARAIRNRYFTLTHKPKTCFVPSSITFYVIEGGKMDWN